MACIHESNMLTAACPMSALPLIADEQRTLREVRFVPTADVVATLLGMIGSVCNNQISFTTDE